MENNQTSMIYQTPRLVIRTFDVKDSEDAYEYLSDPEISKFEFWDPYDRAEARKEIEKLAEAAPGLLGDWNEFAVELKAETKVIGCMSFRMADRIQRQAEMGFHFNRKYHGMGYGKEAAWGLVDYLFKLGAHRVWAVADIRNIGSWKLMEKLGMRREGHLVGNCYVRGQWCDEFLYAILEEEWKSLREP